MITCSRAGSHRNQLRDGLLATQRSSPAVRLRPDRSTAQRSDEVRRRVQVGERELEPQHRCLRIAFMLHGYVKHVTYLLTYLLTQITELFLGASSTLLFGEFDTNSAFYCKTPQCQSPVKQTKTYSSDEQINYYSQLIVPSVYAGER